jgi:hypothetical protein
MTDKFDLRKYLIENEVTTGAKLLKELEMEIDPEQPTGRRFVDVLEIEIGSHNTLRGVETIRDTTSKSFENYCNRRAESVRKEHARQYIEDAEGDFDDEEDFDWESKAETYQEEMGIGQTVFNPKKTACEIMVNDDTLLYIFKKRGIDVDQETIQTLQEITPQTPVEHYMSKIDSIMDGATYTPPDWLI